MNECPPNPARRRTSWAMFVLLGVVAVSLGLWTRKVQRDYENAHARAAMWHSMVDHTTAALLIVDGYTGKILECNDGSERLTGYNSAELMGDGFTKLIPPDDAYRAHHEKLFTDIEANRAVRKKMADHTLIIACDLLRKDKTRVRVELRIRGSILPDGEYLFMVNVDELAALEFPGAL